jgi:putative transposase
MAQDEGCFGRISLPRRCWAPPKVRPQVARQVVREYVYVYSAVAPAIGRMTSLLLPYADTAMMNLFLAHVGQEFSDYFIVMQVDRAGWHDTNQLQIPENMRLILQPAYSPELNPVEHLWDYLRENYFHNWAADTLQQVIDVLIDGLEHIATDIALLRSMTNFPHLRIIC